MTPLMHFILYALNTKMFHGGMVYTVFCVYTYTSSIHDLSFQPNKPKRIPIVPSLAKNKSH